MGTDGFLASVPDFRSSAARDLALTNDFRTVALNHTPLTTAPIIPLWFSLRRAVNRPRAWTRPSKGREEERKRESERKERAKMGTDGFLASVPDFRSSASRDLALTNDFRTVALYHTPLTTAPVIPHWFSLRRAVHRQSSQTVDPSFESARRGEKERE